MTDSLSIQTKLTCHQQSPSRRYSVLPCPVVPLSEEFKAMTQIASHKHAWSQLAFEQAIKLAKEVKECHNVTGSFEYLLRIETKDIKSFKSFHADVLGGIPQVSAITTHVVMDYPKDERT